MGRPTSVVLACVLSAAAAASQAVHPPLVAPAVAFNTSAYTLVATDAASGSALYAITSTRSWVLGAPLLLDLHGTREQQGAAYASLVGASAARNVAALFSKLMPNATSKALVLDFLGWQWGSFMVHHVPDESRAIQA